MTAPTSPNTVDSPEASPIRARGPEIALVLATMLWGFSYLTTSHALREAGPFCVVGLRFAIAALLLTAVSGRRLRGLTRQELGAAIAVGTPMSLSYLLVVPGLLFIPTSTSGFITALYVPLVPLLQLVFLRRAPAAMAWVGILMAFTGLLLISSPEGGLRLGPGELLTLGGALTVAIEIIVIGAFASRVDALRVATVQCAFVAVIGFAAMLLWGEPPPQPGLRLAALVFALGAGSALLQVTMNWAQRSVSPTRATLIYSSEPVWVALVGRAAGERLPPLALVGGTLIVLATVVSELRWRFGRARG